MALPFEATTKEEHFGMTMEDGGIRQLCVTIPDGVEFADLCLSRDTDDGLLHFKMVPIEAICEASALDFDDLVQGPQLLVGLLIAAWYEAHIARRRTGFGP